MLYSWIGYLSISCGVQFKLSAKYDWVINHHIGDVHNYDSLPPPPPPPPLFLFYLLKSLVIVGHLTKSIWAWQVSYCKAVRDSVPTGQCVIIILFWVVGLQFLMHKKKKKKNSAWNEYVFKAGVLKFFKQHVGVTVKKCWCNCSGKCCLTRLRCYKCVPLQ